MKNINNVNIVFKYLGSIIRNNTGNSTLSFIAVAVGVSAILILLIIGICMLIEVFKNHTIATSLDGYASIIREIAILLTSAVLPKAINNYGEHKYKNKEDVE